MEFLKVDQIDTVLANDIKHVLASGTDEIENFWECSSDVSDPCVLTSINTVQGNPTTFSAHGIYPEITPFLEESILKKGVRTIGFSNKERGIYAFSDSRSFLSTKNVAKFSFNSEGEFIKYANGDSDEMFIICHHDAFGECKGQYDEIRRFGGTFCNGLQNCWHSVEFYYTSRLASYSSYGGCLEKASNEGGDYYYVSIGFCNLKPWEIPK